MTGEPLGSNSTASSRDAILGVIFFLLPFLLVGVVWATDEIKPNQLLLDVPKVSLLPWLETRWNYTYLHFFTFVPVFLLSFDKNVHYYKKWRHLLPAITIVAILFIVWDVFFTVQGVWGFNSTYFVGVTLLHLPIEECLFFFTIPFASVFIYECQNFYIKKDILANIEPILTPVLAVIFIGVGFLYWSHIYTSTTFLLTGGFLFYHWLFLDGTYRSRFYLSYLITLIPFLLVNGVLTGGYTEKAVVIYNPDEYLGIRITSVPLDDAVYGFLLIFGIITLFERFRTSEKKQLT